MEVLKRKFVENFFIDKIHKRLFSTDASIYKLEPKGVFYPRTEDEIFEVLNYAKENNISITARGAGTSLAGQAIGKGIIFNFNRFFNKIIEVSPEEQTVIVEPGIVLDKLNHFLKKYNLFFPIETSTSNRCTIGGMIGNNSSGMRALVYGTTKNYVVELCGFLSNGEYVCIKENSNSDNQIINNVNNYLISIIKDNDKKNKILLSFPENSLVKRNNGYALDDLIFNYEKNSSINLTKLICGSEGTLFLITKVKLKLLPIEKSFRSLLCVYLNDLYEGFDANILALSYNPTAIEIIDKCIIESAYKSPLSKKFTSLLNSVPNALLIIEFTEKNPEELIAKINNLIKKLKNEKIGYDYTVIRENDIHKVWKLRKIGLGLLSNIKGLAKPLSIIEDTCVNPNKLKNFVKDVEILLKYYNKNLITYGHVATGELHFKISIDIREKKDIENINEILNNTVDIVKKYKGSLSGEHGDGRLRTPLLEKFFGIEIVRIFSNIKNLFDKYNIFNPNIKVNPLRIDENLRYPEKSFYEKFNFKTYFNNYDVSFINEIENCYGCGECINLSLDTNMCLTYKATLDELFSLRGRINLVREFFYDNDLENNELIELISKCLSCKACKTECPSGIDFSKLKSEIFNYFNIKRKNKNFWSDYFISNLPIFLNYLKKYPFLYNFFVSNGILSFGLKNLLKLRSDVELPKISKPLKSGEITSKIVEDKTVILFYDEFSAYYLKDLVNKALFLLEKFGFKVILTKPIISGRTYISKGFLKKAKEIFKKNLLYLSKFPNNVPIIGIEPSAILTYKDEILNLIDLKYKEIALNIVNRVKTIEEFLLENLNFDIKELFKPIKCKAYVHVHCHFKALIGKDVVIELLKKIPDLKVYYLDFSCCGMAGSYGLEEKNKEIFEKISGPFLEFLKNIENNDLLVLNGFSCRHLVKWKTILRVYSPLDILYMALKNR